MSRSPHASHLNPRWGVDPQWTERAGGPAASVALSGGQVVIDPASAPPAAHKPAVLRPLPCVHLGRVVKRSGCRTCRRDDGRTCDAGRGTVRQSVECETCPGYEPDA
ncbi:hypothetical protein [Gemmata sp.]|uniref:hypothetical protein n=1 Tax=Gemmata sp. TaxID=1914242 RepID=UPI003F70F647